MEKDNRAVSALAALLGLAGALLLLTLFTPMWNHSVVGTVFMVATGLGIIAAILGFIARRAGPNTLNTAGLALGLLTVLASVGLASYFTIEEPVLTEEIVSEYG
jgi:hypothetical protein